MPRIPITVRTYDPTSPSTAHPTCWSPELAMKFQEQIVHRSPAVLDEPLA